jgi:hypothetical protein
LQACHRGIGLVAAHDLDRDRQFRFREPLGTVVVGGMLVGPIMLLVVVPALRMMFSEHVREPEAPRRCGPAGFRLNKVMIHPRSAEVRGELTC